ncbi:aspartic-type endopeptidase [Colletotrichum kahawae]|uniref:Aspartic-type endopeptidase n=1 Tax=Colletotrichum kahawae TaxID=34407 RepID=A0AAD9YN97_COLKA|nr:aspartic-type endopeptidase [Colletotrichum kahawae]
MPKIGFLGLGPKESPSDDKTVGSILEQLKAAGDIKRSAWSLHMGSAALGLPGSLVLGAYEQNRALGNVGQFAIQQALPTVFLRDVFMGTEAGAASSFPASSNASFWIEPKGLGADYVKTFGGAQGSAIVSPNPVSPYIYLQTGVCEAIAENLGLTYHNDTGLYLWESSRNGSLDSFINSPSYLGFVLSDKTATNLTIKVPFKLLNLTLSLPLVEKEVNYFPCKSFDESIAGQWHLGRAFLQATFLGVDYDSNTMYMAQAPGPGMEQSVVQDFDGSIIKTNPSEAFQKSWGNYWTITPLEGDNLINEDKGITAGGTAGIVMAAVVGVTVVLWLLRRRRKRRQGPDSPSDYIDKAVVWFNVRRGKSRRSTVLSDTSSNADTEGGFAMDQKGVNEVNGDYLPPEIGGPEYEAKELDSRGKPAEIDSRSKPAEMATPFSHAAGYPRHEMPANPIVYELPGSIDRVEK